MLRKLFACCVMLCCLGLLTGCEPPKAKDATPPASAEKTAEKGAEKAGDQGEKKPMAKEKVRKKKAPHVTTAK